MAFIEISKLTSFAQILGEKPTFPHQLVTIRCPYHRSSLGGFIPTSSEDTPKAGSICYWALDLALRSIKEVDSIDYYAGSLCLCDYSLSAAFTAWDIDRDKLTQVLVWDPTVDVTLYEPLRPARLVSQKLEFRYGTESIIIDHEGVGSRPVATGACFAGLPGTPAGASMSVLFPCTMILYEPFGGIQPPCPSTSSFWTTAPETNNPAPLPRVTTIDFSRIAASHLQAVLTSYANTPPIFRHPYSAFVARARPVRFRAGERERFDRQCTLAFGAVEARSRMYHVFVIALDTCARSHRIVAAKAFSSSLVFRWENMVATAETEAANLLASALERVVRTGVQRRGDVGGVCIFEEFGCGMLAVDGIRMPEKGVVLKGWGTGRVN